MDGSIEIIETSRYTATSILFLSTVCPISNAYQDRIRNLITSSPAGVRWLLVNANDNESSAEVTRYAEEVRFPVPSYKDWRNVLADRLGAAVTPEAFVLDTAGFVRYSGAIDDARNPARVKVEALRLAVLRISRKESVETQSIRAFGCAIKRFRKS
jgi:hypothetical protein